MTALEAVGLIGAFEGARSLEIIVPRLTMIPAFSHQLFFRSLISRFNALPCTEQQPCR